jgi:hypothetical protein
VMRKVFEFALRRGKWQVGSTSSARVDTVGGYKYWNPLILSAFKKKL